MKDDKVIKFSPEKTETTKTELDNIKKSLYKIKDEITKITYSISANWDSEAAKTLCDNMRSSLTAFQTYIEELNKVSNYLKTTIEEWNETGE